MNRKIKFRALNFGNIWFYSDKIGLEEFFRLFEHKDSSPIFRTPALQYTGLKDKNGKEIYEGDIVRFWSNSNVCLVKWIKVRAGFEIKDGHFTYADMIRSEILGNIYENPELLK